MAGVNIQQYRVAIGRFASRNLHYKSLKMSEDNRLIKNSEDNRIIKTRVGWLRVLLIASTIISIAELNNLITKSTNTITAADKISLSCVSIKEGGKLEFISLNISRIFVKIDVGGGKYYYKFTNLENKYAKYTYGNKKQAGIRIYHFNKGPAHLSNKIHEIENIITKYRPHILGISEANFFGNQDADLVHIENYKFVTAKSIENPALNVSRICVYLHDSMVGKIRADLMDEHFSSIWLEVGLPQKRKILIGNVYREWGLMGQADPSISREISAQNDRWSVFLQQWERALDEDKEVIVLGDMNINHLEWTREDLPTNNQTYKLRPLISALFTRILPHGVSQLVTSPTWSRPNQPESGLDHVYTNQPDKLSPVQVLDCGGSDHKLLGCTRYSSSIRRNVRYVTKRCYKNFRSEDFVDEVKKIKWWKVYECEDAELALKLFSDELTKILDKMAPIRTIQIREKYAPWLSCKTKELMTERDLARKAAIENKSDEYWKSYKLLRNKVNQFIKNEKRNWQKSKFRLCESESDSKQIWKNVKSWLNWTTSGAPTQLFHKGKLENSPKNLAECMNTYFIDKINNLINDMPATEEDPLANLRKLMSGRNRTLKFKPDRNRTFKLKPVHPETVNKLISNLKNSGSVGLDYIDTRIIKLVKTEILPAVTHIINLSIKNSIFPSQFKKAKVIPLHKKGDKLCPKNYRPVAILPVLSKLLERAVSVQVIEYFESNKLFHPNHHGFRANHNTTTALLQMYDTWVEAMDKGEATGVMFLDMSAAFDLVNHSVLLKKLLLYGFDLASVKWIGSYLSDRKQTVCVDGTCSALLPLSVGIPQGSIMGPLLYVIFTNDLPESVHGHPPDQASPLEHPLNVNCRNCGNICCFADDSSYSYSSKNPDEICENIAEKYSKISDYMGCHKLKLNSDKTHLLVVRSDASRRANQDFPVNLNTQSEIVEPSQNEKILGGIISQNLKFTDHIQNHEESMLKTLNRRINALKKVSNMASFKSRKMIANGIITSKLTYLIPLWSGCENYLLQSLQIVQNKAARLVTKCDPRTPVKILLTQCGWLSVAQLSVYHSLVLVYKILANKSPQYLYEKLSGNHLSLHYRTRFVTNQDQNQNIRLDPDSKAILEIANRSFKYRVINQWNQLPVEIKQVSKIDIFKKMLRKWVQENVPIR